MDPNYNSKKVDDFDKFANYTTKNSDAGSFTVHLKKETLASPEESYGGGQKKEIAILEEFFFEPGSDYGG